MEFVAIDFETANKQYDSACSLAAVTVQGNDIVREAYSLIRPPVMDFAPGNIQIHQITPEMVAAKPTFDQLWDRVYAHLEGKIVVAHFALFDIRVLRTTLTTYHIPWPSLKYACTVDISRKVWPELPNHKLNTMGEFLGCEFQHHQALDDARVCAKIVQAAADKTGAKSMEELMDMLGLTLKSFRGGRK